ncbi:MAG TPA: glycoside hydrolase family 15 [Intrasporangium sp.]|uniref:glycoside hydrolase family 15 n=1 Tax=Intrasporangium sp. TaxID=1925024 RepID=UPI002D794ABB|nr:glycoside hydrolase family 15 [Intrasporangium sp.]HET7399206.1 glycoside hydrolase family 15 [Intrasporangium sp.]
MRRLLAALAAAVVLAVVGALAPPPVQDPLPGLRNGDAWRHAAPSADRSLGAGLLGPVEDRLWLLAGAVPGPGTRPLARQALVDLRALTRDNGAVAAGPAGPWAFDWPRDSAFVAAAFAVSGHEDDAWRVLEFFARVQRPDGGFEARYLLDGTGVPDARPAQSDGAGWLLWGMDRVRTATGGGPLPGRLRVLRDRATRFVLAQTRSGRALPPASPDYWEVPERRLTLGTAAPLAAGLEASARTYAAEGDGRRAHESATAAVTLRRLIRDGFGPAYERHRGGGGLDAAVAMLMPPFADLDDPAAVSAWQRYPVLALRSAGGLAPGAEWKQDGVSWTPETALIAYTAAASGRVDDSRQWLEWLRRHRTSWGSLPEKVLPDGSPAGPAPLAWTSALVVLTEAALDERRRTVEDPAYRSVGLG